MGQIFSQLTKTGVYDPASGSANFDTPAPGTLAAAKPLAIGTPPVLNPQTIQPSLPQAAQMGATPGGANALSPALTKGGKLATLLMSGLQGALAGRAKSEETVAATGGRRSGGAGMGFEAGYTLPWQRAQELAQTQVAQGGAQPVQTPYGNMPAALAGKILTPYLGYEKGIDVQNLKNQGAQNVANTAGQYRVQAAQVAARFKTSPNGLYDTQTGQLIPNTAKGITLTPEIAQDYGLGPEWVGRTMTLSDLAARERNQIAEAPTVKSSTDPLGLTTTSTSQKVLPQFGTNPAIPRLAGRPGARPHAAGSGSPASPANGAGGGGSAIDSMAQRIVDGDMDPSQAPKRGAQYTIMSQKADQYSMQKYGQHFDMAQAANDYQYARNAQTQNTLKMINGMTERGGAIDIATNAAKSLPQLDEQTANKVFNAAATEFGSTAATNFHTAMLGLADEYSKVMGGGVSSDTGRDQALSLLRNAYSKGQLAGAVDIMRQDIAARKQALIGGNRYLMRQYGQQAQGQGQGNGGRRTIVF